MRKKMQTFGLLVVLFMSVVSFSGCFALFLGAAAGAGGYAWVNGALEQEFEVPAEKLYKASLKGLKRLDLTIIQEQEDKLSGLIVSEFADGKAVKVYVTALTEETSKVRIRVGALGDRPKSDLIMESIKRYL